MLAVNQVWNGEIPVRECAGNMSEVLSNSIAAVDIINVVRLDFDRASVSKEPKMMSRLCLRESHPLIGSFMARVLIRVLLMTASRMLKKGVSEPVVRILPLRKSAACDRSGQKRQHQNDC
jgi:hypothetical protein